MVRNIFVPGGDRRKEPGFKARLSEKGAENGEFVTYLDFLTLCGMLLLLSGLPSWLFSDFVDAVKIGTSTLGWWGPEKEDRLPDAADTNNKVVQQKEPWIIL